MAPPPAAKKVGKGLSKKIGPLPMWAWGVLAAGGAFVVYWLYQGRGQGNADAPVENIPGVARTLPPEDLANAGGPPGYAPGNSLSPDVLDSINKSLQSLDTGVSYGLANLGEHLNDPAYWGVDASTQGGIQDTTSLESLIADLPTSIAAAVQTVLGPPKTAAATATGAVTEKGKRPQGVKWGGHTFTTKAQMDKWLRTHGSSYSVWEKRHPEASRQLRGSVAMPASRSVRPKSSPRASIPAAPQVRHSTATKVTPKPKQSKPKAKVVTRGDVNRRFPGH